MSRTLASSLSHQKRGHVRFAASHGALLTRLLELATVVQGSLFDDAVAHPGHLEAGRARRIVLQSLVE